jgi:hypothetical protein
MKGGEIRLVRDGDPVGDLDDENAVRKAINGLLGLGVDASTMTLAWQGGSPFLGCPRPDFIVEGKAGAGGIAVAASATQMTSGDVVIWDCNSAGALTVSSPAVTIQGWNKDTAGAVAANAHLVLAKNRAGLYVVIWEQCP